MQRPVLFIARSWAGHGGMQRLNQDVARFVGGNRSGFLCIHPERRTIWSFLSFVFRSVLAAIEHRGLNGRVHVGDAAALPLGVICAWFGGMKLSVTVCGLDAIYSNRIYQWMIRWCLRRTDQVICISAATADEVRKRGVPDNHITIIPCGIDPALPLMRQERDPHLLLTVGRLVKRKGVRWFLKEVFPSLLRGQPNLRYVVAGDGPERRIIERLIRRLNLTNNVILIPRLSDDDRERLLAVASLFVMPNIHVKGDMEGFGIVCVEAAAAGLQIAAANIEGVKDAVIEGATGSFFQSENPEDCARVLRQMIDHPLNPDSVHDAVMHRFAWNKLAPLYTNVFDS